MSIEANKETVQGNVNNKMQGCLSSTSAAGRTLSFSQNGFINEPNYQSALNLQKGINYQGRLEGSSSLE